VATLAACFNMHVKLSIAICTSYCSFSLAAGSIPPEDEQVMLETCREP
jgi:hypothetical protein